MTKKCEIESCKEEATKKHKYWTMEGKTRNEWLCEKHRKEREKELDSAFA